MTAIPPALSDEQLDACHKIMQRWCDDDFYPTREAVEAILAASLPREPVPETQDHLTERAGEAVQRPVGDVRCPFCGSREWPVDYAGQGDHI